MKNLILSGIIGIAAASGAFANITYNAASGFPTTTSQNPNGNWSYAYSDPGSLTNYTLYLANQFTHTGNTSSYSTANVQYNVPLVNHTTGENSLFMHPGPSDQKVIVIFTASFTGDYTISGQWYGVDPASATNGGNGTDVHVLTGGNSLFSGVSNYNSPAAFDLQHVNLAAGQQVEFALGDNNQYYFDSSRFEASVVAATPEPSFYGFLGAGLAGLGVFVRRRRA